MSVSGMPDSSYNKFGLLEVEIDYEKTDPCWHISSSGSNVFHGRYPSANTFIEKLRLEQRACLGRKVKKEEDLRLAIRQRVLYEYEKNRKEHLAKFTAQITGYKIDFPADKKESETIIACQLKSCTHVHNGHNLYIFMYSRYSTVFRILSEGAASQKIPNLLNFCSSSSVASTLNPQITNKFIPTSSLETEACNLPVLSCAEKATSDISVIPPAVITTTIQSFAIDTVFSGIFFLWYLKLASCSSFCISPASEQRSDITEHNNVSNAIQEQVTFTASVSSSISLNSRSNLLPEPQIIEEKYTELEKENANSLKIGDKLIDESPPNTVSVIQSPDCSTCEKNEQCFAQAFSNHAHYHQFFEQEIAFTKAFRMNTLNISIPTKNLLTRTIKEKISITTKKFATTGDVAKIVRFFGDLVSGFTVLGFGDKVVNLKDDCIAQNWAVIHIIGTYLELLSMDMSLLKVIAAILSSLASFSDVFAKLLYGELFIVSSLLSINHDKW
ncbi:unnamed protein product [Thelazia callipaeda]|uniref:C2H2-type domain-containing protein n=1 Tax=Thelazia callipaeda TaxID=103827 RepID=A0A0N5DAL3_THECL|nr:unnamed protein product [Thelazia callipaeda]